MILLYEKRMDMCDVIDDPSILNNLQLGSFITMDDKEYIILEYMKYFYNFLTEELVLTFLVQEVDFSKEYTVSKNTTQNILKNEYMFSTKKNNKCSWST